MLRSLGVIHAQWCFGIPCTSSTLNMLRFHLFCAPELALISLVDCGLLPAALPGFASSPQHGNASSICAACSAASDAQPSQSWTAVRPAAGKTLYALGMSLQQFYLASSCRCTHVYHECLLLQFFCTHNHVSPVLRFAIRKHMCWTLTLQVCR